MGVPSIAAGPIGAAGTTGGNAGTWSGVTDLLATNIDSFVVHWTDLQGNNPQSRSLGASDFANVNSLADLIAVVDAIDGAGPSQGVTATLRSNGDIQVTTPFLTIITGLEFAMSTPFPGEPSSVGIGGVTDAEADFVQSFAITINGVPLDTSTLDLSGVDDRAELAAALDALPQIAVTESSDNGGQINILAEQNGATTFSNISLSVRMPWDPAQASFFAGNTAELEGWAAAADRFELRLNGSELDFSGLDFSAITTPADLVQALNAAPNVSAQLSGTAIIIHSDVAGTGNAFSELELIDNEAVPGQKSAVQIAGVDTLAGQASAFTLSIDGVAVDATPVDFAAAVDGPTLATQLDRIAGIDVAYTAANGGTLTITATTAGAAVFSNVSLTALIADVVPVSPDPSSGSDEIFGVAGANTIAAQDGDDVVHGADTGDLLFGNAGSDTLHGGAGNDTAYGGHDDDLLGGGDGDDLLFGNQGSDTVEGGEGNNTIVGGQDSADGADFIRAGGGHDLIWGNGGADTIDAGDAADSLIGGFGLDSLAAGAGDDVVFANQDNDTVDAGDGADLVFGGFGNDTVAGGAGNDTLWGNEGDDTLAGGAGADLYTFLTGSGSDLVDGFHFDDGDRLDLQGQTFTLGTSADGDVLLTLSGGGTIELNGVTPTNFSPGFVV